MVTRPGFHPSTNFDDYPNELNSAIRAIGKKFYVTRSFQKETVGNSEYWALLARPSDEFSVHLNADRELLFLMAGYSNFEIRTIEAFDSFYSILEQKRVDKSIRFLISADHRIEEIIQRYLSQNPEYPIIIPINLKSFVSDDEVILNSIRRNYVLRDLFGYQNPLREETFFFGRQEQVNAVLDLAKSGQSSSMFGLRKSGKTSSIYAIIRRAKAFDITPVFIDCQSPAVHARRYNELLSYIITQVRKEIGYSKPSQLIEGTDSEIAEQFRDQFRSVVGQAKTRILIVFDEIENISPGTAASDHWDASRDSLLFWQNIRSFVQQEKNGRVALCLVGTSPLLLEKPTLSGVANPMYLFSQKRFIPSFSFEETRQMIDRLGFFMGIEIDPVKIGTLYQTYGGHPFFIRQVCSNIHKNADGVRPISVSNRQLEAAMQEFGGQLEAYMSDIIDSLRSFYPEEFNLLKAVVSGDTSEVSEYGRQTPDLIDHLIGYGLIERKGDAYDLRFDAVRVALRRVFMPRTAEQFWTECMLRRNRIEVDIRRELLIASKAMSPELWKAAVSSSLTKARFEKLKSIEPRSLFSKTKSPLYWSDLIGFVGSQYFFNYLDDRKRDILIAMNKINFDGRKDSHANEHTQQEFDELMAAFFVVEQEFQQPE